MTHGFLLSFAFVRTIFYPNWFVYVELYFLQLFTIIAFDLNAHIMLFRYVICNYIWHMGSQNYELLFLISMPKFKLQSKVFMYVSPCRSLPPQSLNSPLPPPFVRRSVRPYVHPPALFCCLLQCCLLGWLYVAVSFSVSKAEAGEIIFVSIAPNKTGNEFQTERRAGNIVRACTKSLLTLVPEGQKVKVLVIEFKIIGMKYVIWRFKNQFYWNDLG